MKGNLFVMLCFNIYFCQSLWCRKETRFKRSFVIKDEHFDALEASKEGKQLRELFFYIIMVVEGAS